MNDVILDLKGAFEEPTETLRKLELCDTAEARASASALANAGEAVPAGGLH